MARKSLNLLFALGLVAVVFGLGGSWGGAQNPQSPEYGFEDGTAPQGKKDFVKNGCYQCHGFQGQGGVGPRLAPSPLPYENFAKFVRRPRDVMPAYSSKVLTEEKLKSIYEYLKSLPPSPEPSQIPLLAGP